MEIKINNIQNNSNMCMVCGLDNPFGLHAHFYEGEGNIIIGVCKAQDVHQSYPNRMHGGMIAALLDETVGRAVQIDKPDVWAVTGDLKVKYRKPTPLDKTLFCVGKITRENEKFFIAKGIIEDEDGVLVAEGEATYFIAPIQVIAQGGLSHAEWFKDKNAPKIDKIDIKNMNFFEN